MHPHLHEQLRQNDRYPTTRVIIRIHQQTTYALSDYMTSQRALVTELKADGQNGCSAGGAFG